VQSSFSPSQAQVVSQSVVHTNVKFYHSMFSRRFSLPLRGSITNTYVNGEPIPEFVFRGDSSYVCNKFPSSEELSEHVIRTVRDTNTSNKEEMLLLLDQHQL
jgi:hypothetical protein